MKSEIIAVGSELLTPAFQDTNSLYLTEKLNDAGIQVHFKTIVGDDEEDLIRVFKTALKRSRLVLTIGGLGPTEDDRTREVFARVLGRKLIFKKEIQETIRSRFRRRGLPMAATNKKQCFVIEGSEILSNPFGTAPGLWVEKGRHLIALLPGPPHEFRPMVERHITPRLVSSGRGTGLRRRTIRLTGIGESQMEMSIRDLYKSLPPGVSITTLASAGDIAIQLTEKRDIGQHRDEDRLGPIVAKLSERLSPYVYSTDGRQLEAVVSELLKAHRKTLACAESCSGGLLSNRLTDIPGSSDYLIESVVAYSNRSKIRHLRVPAYLIKTRGAVSGPVARKMAEGIRKTSGADYGLAITGIAGPGGGTPMKPVGLVYIALSHSEGTVVRKSLFFGGRDRIKFQSSQRALDLLRKNLIKRRKKI